MRTRPPLLFVWVLALLVCGLAFAQQRQVEATGEAAPEQGQDPVSVRQVALDDALRNAVEIGVGVFINSETLVKNFQLVEDRIFKKAGGFARRDRIIEEGATPDGRYVVKILATVDSRVIVNTLRSIIQGFNDPRIAVFLNESIDGKPTAGSAASTALSKWLIDAGYRVLDQKQLEQVVKRNELITAQGNPKLLAQIATRLKVDIILVGSARASENKDPPKELTNSGFKSVLSILEAKMVDALTAQTIWTDQFESADYALSLDAAVSKALQAAGNTAAESAIPQLAKWIQDVIAGPVYVLKVLSFKSFSAFNTFVQRLSAQPNVVNVQPRDYDEAGTEIEVQYRGRVDGIATLVEKLGLQILAITGREIRARAK